ncbi:type II secretion system F family protein [Agromyces aurantiacus]|uniref:Type II secretion system F family protein n=1 Tax=Agromyces aurantiacus TaxID=165814 RepID=A0ABV9R8Y9_9MICO|nr:type II secretion system F family protein [Agromyces aurantiacus]MBM7503282.1 tight adherence protein C [Agromyces aurantiacus]
MTGTWIAYISIGAVAISIGALVFIVFTTIPAKADVVAAVAPANELERKRVERASFSETLAAVMPTGYTGWVQRKIIYAGRAGTWTVGGFLLIRLIVTIVAVLIILGAVFTSSSLVIRIAGIAFGLLILLAPEIMLSSRADDRQKAILLALPDTLDQMTIAVEAGLGFEAAMAKAAQGGRGPLSEELIRTLQDMSIGRSRSDAYSALLVRTDCTDLKRFVRAVQQADRYGIAIADVLRVQAAEMRIKRRQRAEESAMKVPIKVVFPLVFAILPVLFIVLLYPAVVGIIKTFG